MYLCITILKKGGNSDEKNDLHARLYTLGFESESC